jgi:hypothetical protein
MDLGFETCGNATIIGYEADEPIIVTDPWIHGQQYFGAWKLPYAIPQRQRDAISRTRFIWLSHGHPDHLNLDSLSQLTDRTILVPQHYGRRIFDDLSGLGYKVREAINREWIELSPRIRFMSLADWNQDAVCLIAFDDKCVVVNLNDGGAYGNEGAIKRAIRTFPRRFILRLVNYGDADMMNFFTESGERIPPPPAAKPILGLRYNETLRQWRGTHTTIFSCHHVFARKDVEWAAAHETPLEAHAQGFDQRLGEFIPGYFSYHVTKDSITPLEMVPEDRAFRDPQEFGDNWSDVLEVADIAKCAAYFKRFEHLRTRIDFINLRVGGVDNRIILRGEKDVGVTFEVPRASLMSAIEFEVFDDLLIGNFMKTTLHGGLRSLYPDFNPYVPKFGDNGKAHDAAGLRDYEQRLDVFQAMIHIAPGSLLLRRIAH